MIDEIYNRRVLELAADIPRLGRLASPDATAKAHSRLCGSTVIVDLAVKDGHVVDFAHDVRACALGQASSSLMARHVIGASAEELFALRDVMTRMLKANGLSAGGQVGRVCRARARARLQGPACVDAADLRRGRRCPWPDRSAAGAGRKQQPRHERALRRAAPRTRRSGSTSSRSRASSAGSAAICRVARPMPTRPFSATDCGPVRGWALREYAGAIHGAEAATTRRPRPFPRRRLGAAMALWPVALPLRLTAACLLSRRPLMDRRLIRTASRE